MFWSMLKQLNNIFLINVLFPLSMIWISSVQKTVSFPYFKNLFSVYFLFFFQIVSLVLYE